MHELSLCQNAVEIIEQQARQNGAQRVTGVWLEVGALACVEESALRFGFDIACRETLAQGCTLHILHKPAQAWCWNCSQTVEAERHDECPLCHCPTLHIERSDGVQIKSIEVE
ncbi:hydrogenase maturation nickel metallochaperone HypA [Enterobacter sp. R4-368]|uniref:hydrogenase maturation nickel metallochaperone HypA n=1 Tax=Enterobacteriaceae TaxID=543 RepID=UPI00034F1FFC|nr:hydrogenase maturation nickel metallochaperone HypA [Enterobacter sp. R4-368]AGN85754.1 hydrogenase nickel incorporation protein [Enterobacter sp. R4-368]